MRWGSGEFEDVKLFLKEASKFWLKERVVIAVNFVLPWDEKVIDIIRSVDRFFQCCLEDGFEVFFLPKVPDRNNHISTWLRDAGEFCNGLFSELLRGDMVKCGDRKRGIDRGIWDRNIEHTSQYKMVVGECDFCLFEEVLTHIDAGIRHVKFQLADESAVAATNVGNG